MSKSQSRHDDGRRNMPKLKCPVCGKRVIDFADVDIRRQSELLEYRFAETNDRDIDMVIRCPNALCGADLAVCIKVLHGLVNVPIVGTVIS